RGGDRVVDAAIAIVVDGVAGDLERAGIDELRIAAAIGGRVAAIAAARGEAIGVGIAVLVDLAVAVVVERVAAQLAARHDLAIARSPAAARVTCLGSGHAGPDTLRARGARVTRLRRAGDARRLRIAVAMVIRGRGS